MLDTLEKTLTAKRTQEAKQRRKDDPAVIFQDLRDEKPLPVQMLLDQKRAVVAEVDHEESAIITNHDVPWNKDEPVHCNGSGIEIIEAEESKMWLASTEGIEEGMQVEQENYVGRLTDLFGKFGQEWSARWDRHLHVDESRWDPLVQFAELALPRPPAMEYQPITKEMWQHALKTKKKKAATGPDGISRQDLMNLPPKATEAILDLFAGIEQGRDWPRQLVVGVVAALAKIPTATTTNHFRPITILPVAFRTWSSIRARQILQHLQQVAPPTCAGSVPGKQAADIWYNVMVQVETAQCAQSTLAGGVVDLEKAFNMLPRMPILEFMRILGVPPQILVAWSKALIALERRFTIHQCMGPPLKSSSGFAEGCSLSVTSMLAANLVVHQYMLRRYPSVMLWTFVDNWEVTGPDANSIIEAIEGLHACCHAMDMVIDDGKSYTWSVAGAQRRQLRDNDNQVRLAAKDLGGHVQYSQVVTNSSIASRCLQIKRLWGRLARSMATYRQKVLALRSKAWASCLHGIASVHLGEEHFQKLRTGAVQGLGEHSPGTSPPVHLSLVENPACDPQYHALAATVTMFRTTYPHPEVASYVLTELHMPRKTVVPRPGPVSVLLARLHQIAWTWQQGTVFLDQWQRQIDIYECPAQELTTRLMQAWQQRIQGQAAERKTMKGMQWMSPPLTCPSLKTMEPESQALLRASLNGTFFTADRQKHHMKNKDNPEADKCRFCSAVDSQSHRQWDCPHFASVRCLTAAQIETVKELPPSISAHGWMPEPPSLLPFQQGCLAIPDQHRDFVMPPSLPETLDCFTDGGCLAPTSVLGRLASWAVVFGDVANNQYWPLANGLVPGWTQTALRGELWAMISAMTFAIQQDKSIRVWCDNHTVVTKIRAFQTNRTKIKRTATNADLWRLAKQLTVQLGDKLKVIKVSSHQDTSKAADEAESWIFDGNEAADRLAQAAFAADEKMHQLWMKLQTDIESIHVMRNQIHATIVAVAKEAIKSSPPRDQPEDKQHPSRIQAAQVEEVGFSHLGEADIPTNYDCTEGHRISTWLQNICDQGEPLQAISWFQLNVLFEYEVISQGVRYNKSRKKWENLRDSLKSLDFVARTKSFSKWTQGFSAALGKQIVPLHLRPESEVLGFWTMCVPIRMKSSLRKFADSILQASAPRLASVRSLRSL
jgi:ribonuclease HI